MTNASSGKIISGTYSDEIITNSGSRVTIDSGGGDDTITNSGDYVSIYASSGDDSINNNGSFVTIDASNDDDTIVNNGVGVSIDTGYGNNRVENDANSVTIHASTGEDTIINRGNYVSIIGGVGDDSVVNSLGNNVTIDAGNGDDTIISESGNNASIDVGHGNNFVSLGGFGSGVTVRGSIDDDTLVTDNYYGAIYQYVGGHDLIQNWNSNGRISLYSDAYYTRETVNGSVVIHLAGDNALTLQGASGKTVNITGGILSVTSGGSGKNISNSNSNTIINGTSYADTIRNNASNVTVTAGAGNDTIYDSGNYNSVVSGTGADSVYGNNNYTTISTGAGNDTITGNHYKSKLSGDGDNDLISITTYSYNTIDGGDGADTIAIEGGVNHSINGGSGNDSISLGSATELTVKGGAGNDIIYGNTATSHLYQYANGDGKDKIIDWSSNDTLTVTGGSYSATTKGSDVIITVGDGSISLIGAKDKTVNINGKKITTSTEKIITPQDVIKKFMYSLDKSTLPTATAMLDEAIKYASNSKYTTLEQVRTKMVAECKSYNGDGKSFLKEKCDIDLDNDDTGAITGYDAGGSATQKGASDIVPESGSVDKSFTDDHFSSNGLKVYLAKEVGDTVQVIDYYDSSLDSTKRYIWQALRSLWLPSALNLITESYGDNFSFVTPPASNTINGNLYVVFQNDPRSSTLASVKVINNSQGIWINSNGDIVGSLKLTINMAKCNSVIVDDIDGKRSDTNNKFYLDRLLAHEFTHAVMNANVRYATGSNGFASIY